MNHTFYLVSNLSLLKRWVDVSGHLTPRDGESRQRHGGRRQQGRCRQSGGRGQGESPGETKGPKGFSRYIKKGAGEAVWKGRRGRLLSVGCRSSNDETEDDRMCVWLKRAKERESERAKKRESEVLVS